MNQRAAAIDDVGHVTLTLSFARLEQGLAQPAYDFGGIIAIEQECPDTIFAHRPHTVTEHQPAGFRFHRRTAIA